MFTVRILVAAALASALSHAALATGRDGETVYKTECANCHDSGAARMPAFAMLQGLEPGRIVDALQTGAMV